MALIDNLVKRVRGSMNLLLVSSLLATSTALLGHAELNAQKIENLAVKTGSLIRYLKKVLPDSESEGLEAIDLIDQMMKKESEFLQLKPSHFDQLEAAFQSYVKSQRADPERVSIDELLGLTYSSPGPYPWEVVDAFYISASLDDARLTRESSLQDIRNALAQKTKLPFVDVEFRSSAAVMLISLGNTAVMLYLFATLSAIKLSSSTVEKGEGLDWIFFLPGKALLPTCLGGCWLLLPTVASILSWFTGVLDFLLAFSIALVLGTLGICVSRTAYQTRKAIFQSHRIRDRRPG